MIEKIITIKDFTSEERIKAIEMLMESDTLNAIEFIQILKKDVDKEKSQILGELIRCLRVHEKDRSKQWLEKYKLLEEK
ncbi:MAG: hypothetical protein HFJ29_01040 [Clostridia bacterium]|nr:hypothetical protein [Clostridia bacterium]